MTTAKTLYRLKTVCCGLLISTSVLSTEHEHYCSINDFRAFWPTVFEVYLTETLSEHQAPPQIINGSEPNIFWDEATQKSTAAYLKFSALLKDYPELCLLNQLPLNNQTTIMLSTMLHERESLTRAFSAGQLSVNRFTTLAINHPHFHCQPAGSHACTGGS